MYQQNLQSFTSRNAMEKYMSKRRGVRRSNAFSLSEYGLLTAACNIVVITGDDQGRS